MARLGVIARHAAALPESLAKSPVTLGEGDTPLVRLETIPRRHGVDAEIWCKVEGANPTGSFKDRGMAVAVTAARDKGATTVVCASTGNTSASAAAYAARAGMGCVVLLPGGAVASGKLAQAVAHGARILTIDGNFDDGMKVVKDLDEPELATVNSINPMRIQGQKTIAFEVIEALGRAPDVHALPVGNAGNITAHWIGYREAAGQGTEACNHCGGDCGFKVGDGRAPKPPTMLGVQASGAAPFLSGAPVEDPETVATAIRIGNPQSWEQAKTAVAESGGRITAVDDDYLLEVHRQLSQDEGVFCEPSSAAGLAGLLAEAKEGRVPKGSLVVCTLTGHGLKDPDIVTRDVSFEAIPADPGGILAAIGG